MNCMSKKVRLRKEQMAYELEKAKEEEYLNSLSEEERAAYLKSEEERGRRAMQFLAATMAISAGAYSDCMAQNLKEGTVSSNDSNRSNKAIKSRNNSRIYCRN